MPNRRKPFTRLKNPRKLVPTQSTTQLLLAIHQHEGMLSQRQLIDNFFPGQTKSWPETRLKQYFDHHLVNKFNAEWVNGEHLGETVYTLGNQGARNVARLLGTDFTSLTWRNKPRWINLSHDLKLNDVRLVLTAEANHLSEFQLVKWISELELQQMPGLRARPDGFLKLRRQSPTANGVEELSILVEIDNATHPLGRFVNRKVKPAIRFLGSAEYRRLFDTPGGAYFVVTSGPKRLENLLSKTEDAGGKGIFFFTTFDQIGEGILTAPIWRLAGSDESLSIREMPLIPRLRHPAHHTTQRQIAIAGFGA